MATLEEMENGSTPFNKWAFVGKSAMTFGQILFTVGVSSQFFKGLTAGWRLSFIAGILFLTAFAILVYPMYPTEKKGGHSK